MSQPKIKIGVVGATGMVGKSFIETLSNRNFSVSELRPFASENSLGKTISFQGKNWPLQTLQPQCFEGLDLVFFSSGDDISKEWAPQAASQGAWAVDNSAAFRMSEEHLLIVPEVNGDLLPQFHHRPAQVIANPNCSTIQLVVALKPLQQRFGLEAVRVASYQAVSGAGQAAHDELLEQTRSYPKNTNGGASNFPHPIAFNCIPQIGSFSDNGFSSEEMKIMRETRKILREPQLKVSAFTVRVPVLNAHAEAVWVTLQQRVSEAQMTEALSQASGLVLMDGLGSSVYPTQVLASGQDPVFVGRVHRDLDDPYTWLMWVVADNVRKGAALNGIQIAESMLTRQ